MLFDFYDAKYARNHCRGKKTKYKREDWWVLAVVAVMLLNSALPYNKHVLVLKRIILEIFERTWKLRKRT